MQCESIRKKDVKFLLFMVTFSPFRDPEATIYAIKRSCENKAAVVAADEKEGGLRATLNLGHTFGHVRKTCHNFLPHSCLFFSVILNFFTFFLGLPLFYDD